MRIALDATYSLGAEPSGVAVYCRSLIDELCALHPDVSFYLAYRPNRLTRAFRETHPAKNCTRVVLEGPATRLWSRRVDLFHGLNQRLPSARFARKVVTFHDLFVMTAEYSSPEFRAKFTDLAKRAAEQADHIIAVSGFTASETARLLGYPREKITTIYHGVRTPPRYTQVELSVLRKELSLDGPFVLHVGAIQTRKNCLRLIDAFERIPGGPLLVFAGGAGYGADETLARIDLSPAKSRIRWLGYVDADTRAKLYRTATALAFPSLAEGFGLPVLEAMAAGLPVLASNTSALPEVAGGAAVLVDPLDIDAMGEGLTRLLADEELRHEFAEKGMRRAEELTWRRAAQQTWQVYQDLIQEA
ncbi:MAG: glycosyltransferase family 1 protein [Bryobacterales bacterium]